MVARPACQLNATVKCFKWKEVIERPARLNSPEDEQSRIVAHLLAEAFPEQVAIDSICSDSGVAAAGHAGSSTADLVSAHATRKLAEEQEALRTVREEQM